MEEKEAANLVAEGRRKGRKAKANNGATEESDGDFSA